MSALVPSPPPADAVCVGCGHDGASHHDADIACGVRHDGGTGCWAPMPQGQRADGSAGPAGLCECRAFVEPVPEPLEDPHDSPLHHPYRLGRDLPAPSTTPIGDPR